MIIQKIVSGGQTGADRAAFDSALANGIEIGGYVPHGRMAEDGPISETYRNLTETASGNPAERTELNILHSDAILIISRGDLTGGSKLTASLATRYKKPLFHLDLNTLSTEKAANTVCDWIASGKYEIINVAGPRASEDEGIYDAVRELLTTVFTRIKRTGR